MSLKRGAALVLAGRGRGSVLVLTRMTHRSETLILGSGIAGLTLALEAAEHGEVALCTKRAADDCASRRAQGGIAAVLTEEDSFEQHIRDTHQAGAGLCRDAVVDLCVREAPGAVRWLSDRGVQFTRRSDGALDLGREGGHSTRRVAHVGDVSGAELERVLLQTARGHHNIRILEWQMGVDLITLSRFGGPDRCVGAYILDERSGRVETHLARTTVLATGGAGKAYLYTSNPDIATGDGVAMAFRAGAEIANMEFFQFHPTVLYEPRAKSFLISEALRGEGATLCLPSGEPFMHRHHPAGDLASRDIVARAIDYEMKRTGSEYVLLDATKRPSAFLKERFPSILSECARFGIDIATQPIPVVPAAHYMCGGVTSDLDGRTSLPGLVAVGEVSCTGLHGANRLASNSLLEAVVFARRAAARIGQQLPELGAEPHPCVPEWVVGDAQPSDEAVVVSHSWDEVRRLMWNYVGIVRSDSRLRRASRRIAVLEEEIREYYWRHVVTRDLLELRNIQTVAELVIASASSRHESRGLHYTIDYPDVETKSARDTVVKRGVIPHLRGS